MQTILGAGGAIGFELAKSLQSYTKDIRLVNRNPKKVNPSDSLFAADLSNKDQVAGAIKGSEICYLTLGYSYSTKIWREKWPPLIKNVVEACITYNAKLVFFDNVYAIGRNNTGHITEISPISPTSKKGEIRAQVDRHILDKISSGSLTAIIARAPDFFGPVKANSVLMNLVYDNLFKNKAAQWFCNADVPHTMGYTPDLAHGTALLGNTPDAYNQIWNLPTSQDSLTGREWVKVFSEAMGKEAKVQVLPAWGIYALGLFVPILAEMYEMHYQFDSPYHFDSSAFCKRFSFTPTTIKDAVKQTLERVRG